jgi:ATP-binding cassette subfamily F protein 3
VASHDRAFLDNVVERIWELRDRQLTTFRGAYAAYLLQREAADARARSVAGSTDAAIKREEELVQRYRSQRKHVKMHEHERRLETLRASRAEAPRAGPRLNLPGTSLLGSPPARSAEIVVSLEDMLCGYPAADDSSAVPVTRVARLEVGRGDRIGLVGPNGAGKSTLLRTIAGDLRALEGFVRVGRNVMPGYLSQLRDRPLAGTTVLEALTAVAPVTPGAARSYLARFLFRGDDVAKPVSELSGGERSRLELALLGVGAVNLLLLDEPTNHLDIAAREALEAFLRETAATLIVVSHDRRLLESTCRRLWVVEPAGVSEPALVAPFDGGYRAWRTAVADGWTVPDALARRGWSAPGSRTPAPPEPVPEAVAAAAGPRTRTRAAGTNGAGSQRPRLSKDAYRREHERIEADLERLAGRKAALESALEDPSVQANFVELRRLGSELAEVDGALSQAEDAWLTLEERAPR